MGNEKRSTMTRISPNSCKVASRKISGAGCRVNNDDYMEAKIHVDWIQNHKAEALNTGMISVDEDGNEFIEPQHLTYCQYLSEHKH